MSAEADQLATDPVVVDGSRGEGGGQVVRTAVSLSAVTGRPVRVVNVRANRDKPGLRPQHRAAVLAAAAVGGGAATGAEVGGTDLTFWPGDPAKIKGGSFRFDVGTAGSAPLVLQTVLPILLRATGPSDVVVTGGTHNPFAPPAYFLRYSFQNALRKIGYDAGFRLTRPGFYPAGGGRIELHVRPTPVDRLQRIEWLDRGRLVSLRCEVLVAHLPEHVARRELATLRQELQGAGWPLPAVTVNHADDAVGPGNAVSVRAIYDDADEVFTGFGSRGKRAEEVAHDAAAGAVRWLTAGVPVGPHLADQVLLPLALGKGGRFVTVAPLDPHATTNADVIAQILGAETIFTEFTTDGRRALVEVRPPP